MDSLTPHFPIVSGPAAACRESNRANTGPNSPGSVIVFEDRFDCQFLEESHGSLVHRSLRSSGFQGQIQHQGLHHTPLPGNGIHDSNLSPAETRKRLEDEVRRKVVDNLKSYTEALNHQSRAGVKNSVVNISGGLNKADLLRNFMKQLENSRSPAALQNLAKAFGVDLQKLSSPDPAVSGPEHRKLQQGLVDSINRGLDGNPEVNKARKDYDQAVRRFESNHNSVVVSVGNTGEEEQRVYPGVKLPTDFQKSFNVNDQVTPVGSSIPGIGRMPYTSNERSDAIHTDGMAPGDNVRCGERPDQGTSYAAPRVSGLLAEIHRRYPNLTSQQAENLLRQQLTNQSRGYTEVDPQKSRRFLAEG